jgi:biotin synthase
MLSRAELRSMLLARGSEQQELFVSARAARKRGVGEDVILRGVIEVTNVCRVNCDYCPMRRANTSHNKHYFLSSEQIIQSAIAIKDCGINIILLQGGETPGILPAIEEAIPTILDMFDGQVEILLNLGCFSRKQYARLKNLGAISYILKHETSDPDLHWNLRYETVQHRLRCLNDLRDLGFKTGTGFISGLPGQSLDSIIDDIELVSELGVDMCSVSPFIPAHDTPLAHEPSGCLDTGLNAVACLRLLYPHLLIPSVSAFERAHSNGQINGLNAGANVLTVNFSSSAWRDKYLIYGKDRFVVTVEHVQSIAKAAGLALRGSAFLTSKGAESIEQIVTCS